MKRGSRGARRHVRVGSLAVLALAPLLLGGCESTARQDPLFIRPSSDSLVFEDTAFFRDRPLSESLLSSLVLADYTTALNEVGLLPELGRAGPYTVFAAPNGPMEALQQRFGGRLLAPENVPAVRQILAATILPGRYDGPTLRALIAKRGGPIALRSIDGQPVSIAVEPATNQLVLVDQQGRPNRLWLSDMPQSNGVLFATQSLIEAPAPAVPPNGRVAAR